MANKYISPSKLSIFLENLKNVFSPLAHTHKLTEITDYIVDSELSSTSTNPVANKAINDEFDAIGDAMGALELAIDGKADKAYVDEEMAAAIEEAKTDSSNKDAVILAEVQSNLSNYYTKAEIDAIELITIADIDSICGVTT